MLFGLFAVAQIPRTEVAVDTKVFPKETVQLSINSNMLLAGELLQYKAYSLNAANRKSNLSKVLYVSMRNENDSVVFTHKLKVKKGTAPGDFFIPSSLKTGIYRLIGYTNFSRNNNQDAFVEKNIYVINSFVKTEKITGKSMDTVLLKKTTEFKSQEALKSQLGSQITTDKLIYGFREKVTVNIQNLSGNNQGNYVLSVRKINPIEISDKSKNTSKPKLSESFYIPEIRGEIISGSVLTKTDNRPVANKEVSLTIPGKNYVFKIAKTNSNGRFFFSVSEDYNAEKSIIQLNETKANAINFNLVLDKKDFELGISDASLLKLDPAMKDWLEERSVQMQIENAYYDTKKDSILNNDTDALFYNNLGTLFLLDDYTRFPSVRETFIEVVTLAAIRGSGGSNSRFVVNNEYDPNGTANFNDIPPLVLMDGMQILNNNDLINYNSREIKSIRVINKPYRFSPKIFSGIIAVETKKGDFVPSKDEEYIVELNLPPTVKDKKYFRPNYSQNTVNSRIPDYRVQLLWQPDFVISKGVGSTTFYTSDVGGVFEILLEGYSEEGTYTSTKNYFTVTEN